MTETKVISDDIQTTKQSKKNRFFGFLGRNWSWILSATITAVFMLVLMIAGNVKPFGDRSFTMVDSIKLKAPAEKTILKATSRQNTDTILFLDTRKSIRLRGEAI